MVCQKQIDKFLGGFRSPKGDNNGEFIFPHPYVLPYRRLPLSRPRVRWPGLIPEASGNRCEWPA